MSSRKKLSAKRISDSNHVARICKNSTCPDGKPSPASFEFRFDDKLIRFAEDELSVHWIEFHGANRAIKDNLVLLAKFLVKPVIQSERSIAKNDRFAVLPVGLVHNEHTHLEGTLTSFECAHTPRVLVEPPIDSHSSIFPDPGVASWPAQADKNPSAYHFAVQSYLSNLAFEETFKIQELAKLS